MKLTKYFLSNDQLKAGSGPALGGSGLALAGSGRDEGRVDRRSDTCLKIAYFRLLLVIYI